VTQENKGKRTAGIDGKKYLNPSQRRSLIRKLSLHTPAKPVRRVWIDKPGKPEKRPLGIPVIHDRAAQMLIKMAIEPEWEAKFEPHSFGFRPGRSCQDAIQAIFLTLSKTPRYVWDADIASCFDKINHTALLKKVNTFPLFARSIKAWLQAGIVDRNTFTPSYEGTPQGGVISPLLANIALHGMEEVLRQIRGPDSVYINGKRTYLIERCIRYADDFVVFHPTYDGILRCKETLQEWLKDMGLELKEAKTRIAHSLEAKEETGKTVGFDFLGYTIRQFNVGKYQSKSKKSFKLIIKPSKASIKSHYRDMAEIIERMKASPLDEVINRLNPKIIGWSNYYSTVVSSEIYQSLDTKLRWKMYCWAKRKHPRKGKRWVFSRYFKPEKERNRRAIQGKTRTLKQYSDTKIRRHEVLREGATPFDGNWSYWTTRRGKYPGMTTTQGKLLKAQEGKCSHCGLVFLMEDRTEIHHKDRNRKNTKRENLTTVHLHCHDLLHGTGTHDKSNITEEPYAGKLARTVLKTRQGSDSLS
jgi:RNA-directed DNA polymerase